MKQKVNFEKIKNQKFLFFITTIIFGISLILIYLMLNIFIYDNLVLSRHSRFLTKKNEKFVQLEKNRNINGNEDDIGIIYPLSNTEISDIIKKVNELNYGWTSIYRVGILHNESNDIISFVDTNDLLKINDNYKDLYTPYTFNSSFLDIVELNEFSNYFTDNLIGSFPKTANEIIISNQLANLIMEIGIKPYGQTEYFYPKSYDEILNTNNFFSFGDYAKVKVVGIINYDLDEFDQLKNLSWKDYTEEYYYIGDELNYKNQNIFNKIYVNSEFIKEFEEVNLQNYGSNTQNKIVQIGIMALDYNNKGFHTLFQNFKTDSSITIKSTYSDLILKIKQITDNDIIRSIVVLTTFIFVVLTFLLINNFLLSKKDIKKQIYIRDTIGYLILIGTISFFEAIILLIFVNNCLKNFILYEEYNCFNLFYFDINTLIILFTSTLFILIISYFILCLRSKCLKDRNRLKI